MSNKTLPFGISSEKFKIFKDDLFAEIAEMENSFPESFFSKTSCEKVLPGNELWSFYVAPARGETGTPFLISFSETQQSDFGNKNILVDEAKCFSFYSAESNVSELANFLSAVKEVITKEIA